MSRETRAKRLKHRIAELGITQKAIAAEVGWSESTISRVLNEKDDPVISRREEIMDRIDRILQQMERQKQPSGRAA